RERAGIFGGNRDQQTAGGLRVEEQRFHFLRDFALIADQAFGKITIRFESAGNVARVDTIERTFERRNVGGLEDEADVRCQRHFASVADEAEAGDVGESVDSKGVVSCWLLVVGRATDVSRFSR